LVIIRRINYEFGSRSRIRNLLSRPGFRQMSSVSLHKKPFLALTFLQKLLFCVNRACQFSFHTPAMSICNFGYLPDERILFADK